MALLALLAVVAGVVGMVAWRNWQHTQRFGQLVARCLPSVLFPSDGAAPPAMPGCLRGKILLCGESGGPCSLSSLPDPQIIADGGAETVATVIFIRRNDHAPKVRTFRAMRRPSAKAPVAYEMCAVEAVSGRRLCAETVVAWDHDQAVQALCRLIERCVRR